MGDFFSFEYRHIFNPKSEADRKYVATKAYVNSPIRQNFTTPLTQILQASLPPSIVDMTGIGGMIPRVNTLTHNSKELILLVGAVGCGKSTFVDHLIHEGIPKATLEKTIWLRLNLNDAPIAKDALYEWALTEIATNFRSQNSDTDFDDLSQLLKIFSVEHNAFKKTYGKLLGENSIEYKTRLADTISSWTANKLLSTNALIRFFCAEKRKALVLVLDNSDKRNRDDQLVMFDVANWLRSQFLCTIFLPIRDVTYDRHRNEPPLDTAIKDLSFRIDAPSLSEVLFHRVQLVLGSMGSNKSIQYKTSNGIRVTVPKDDKAFFLWSLIKSIFDSSHLVKEMVQGLTGANIRLGIEMFLDICKSKHIPDDELMKIRQSEGDYSLPKHVLFWVLMLGSKKYYADSHSIVSNLFASDTDDKFNDPFIRLDILLWLREMKGQDGPNGVRGYHKLSSLASDLIAWGHPYDVILREIERLYEKGCVLSESQSEKLGSEDQLLCISKPGLTHLKLLDEVVYLSACSQDSWFDQQASAQKIGEIITGKHGHPKDIVQVLECTDILLSFLEEYNSTHFGNVTSEFFELKVKRPIVFSEIKAKVLEIKKKNKINDPDDIAKRFPPQSSIRGRIVHIFEHGMFVELEIDIVGFLHRSHFNGDFKIGEKIEVEVIEFNIGHGRLTLKIP